MEILLATNNPHKKEELSLIIPQIKFILPEEEGFHFQCEETGQTYFENALLKAEALFAMANKPVLADDSGLSVPALNGAPGIYSARYGSSDNDIKLTDEVRNRYLLEKMNHISDRQAFFVCCLVLVLGPYRLFSVQETFAGYIADKPSGANGFGYDPVFYIKEKNKTLAELSPEEKNLISHRGRAGKVMAELLQVLNK